MSSLKDKLKKLSFFTHYPKKHETLTINNNSEEFSSKEEIWGEWFTNDYTNGIWMFNELCVIIKFNVRARYTAPRKICERRSSWCTKDNYIIP